MSANKQEACLPKVKTLETYLKHSCDSLLNHILSLEGGRALRRESQKIKLQNFGHMSKVDLPYLPSTLVWTKKGLDKYSSVYPTYLSKKFGRFVIKVC